MTVLPDSPKETLLLSKKTMSVTCAEDVPADKMIDAKGAGATEPVMVLPLSPNETPLELLNANVATTAEEAPAVTASSPPPTALGSTPSATTWALASCTLAITSFATSV